MDDPVQILSPVFYFSQSDLQYDDLHVNCPLSSGRIRGSVRPPRGGPFQRRCDTPLGTLGGWTSADIGGHSRPFSGQKHSGSCTRAFSGAA